MGEIEGSISFILPILMATAILLVNGQIEWVKPFGALAVVVVTLQGNWAPTESVRLL